MKKAMKQVSNQSGVTLIELLAVIVILGILAAVAVPAVMNSINDADTKADAATESIIKEATQRFLIDNPDELPDTGTGTIDIEDDLVAGGYLNEIPKVPSDQEKTYETVTIDENGKVETVNKSS